MKTAVQLYMVRDCIASEAEIQSTLASIKEAGYDAIELCGFLMDAKWDWIRLVKESGLEVCSSHEIFEEMVEEPEKFIQKARDFNTKYMVCAGTMKTDAESLASVNSLIAKLNELGEKIPRRGDHPSLSQPQHGICQAGRRGQDHDAVAHRGNRPGAGGL